MAKRLSVAQLNGYIKGMFGDELLLHNIEVFGELRDFSLSGNNTYFTLWDGGCSIPCMRFGTLERFPAGMKVVVFGTVTFFDKAGRVSLNVKSVTSIGEGAEHLKLLKLKETLKTEGLFEKGLPLPNYIKTAAVITSVTGAVIHDIKAVLKKNNSIIELNVIHTKVQGGGADEQMCAALDIVSSEKDRFDCVIIARGGGSALDLDIFNSEKLARAVANCPVPVVSAVGHEVDFTLCDLCSKTRAGTPSIAAEILCDINARFFERLYRVASRLSTAVLSMYSNRESRLYRVQNVVLKQLEFNAIRSENKLLSLIERIKTNAERLLERKQNAVVMSANSITAAVGQLYVDLESRFEKAEGNLEKNSPLKILSKGYAKVMQDGKPLSNAESVSTDGDITVLMHDGDITASVKSKILNKKEVGKRI